MEKFSVSKVKRERVDWGGLLDEAWGEEPGDLEEAENVEAQDDKSSHDPSPRIKLEKEMALETPEDKQPLVIEGNDIQGEEKAAIEEDMYLPRKLFPIFTVGRKTSQESVNRKRKAEGKQEPNLDRDEKKRHKRQKTTHTNSYNLRGRKSRASTASFGGTSSSRKKLHQTYLDLGQKNFGHVTCKVCGMVYIPGQDWDEKLHTRFHKQFFAGVAFQGWRKERVVAEYSDGRVVVIYPSDPKHHLKKAQEVCAMVDSDLGYAEDVRTWSDSTKIFLYISTDKKVIGCAFAENISQAYQVISPSPSSGTDSETVSPTCSTATSDADLTAANTTELESGEGSGLNVLSAWCCTCSSRPQPALVGLNRVWVCSRHRRRGVASRLLDTVRLNFLRECVIPIHKLAFSQPTPNGKVFAANYCRTQNFLVYF